MTKADYAAKWIESIANNNIHGYSQFDRWGNPDYDCSSLVISAYEQAGVPVKENGATFTGNMLDAFLKSGFYDVTHDVNLNNCAGMKRGDVLLNVANHTAMYVGDGKIVHARGTDGHPEPGDQTGNEIRSQNYWNYPWDYVLRYPDSDDGKEDEDFPVEEVREYLKLEYPMGVTSAGQHPMDEVRIWQMFLLQWGYNLNPYGADGEFGGLTKIRTQSFQKRVGLPETGVVGEDEWKQVIWIAR